MTLQLLDSNPTSKEPRSVFISDLKHGEIWKGLEWKKIISGWVKKGTLLKIYDSAPPTRQNPGAASKTVVVSCVCFSREMAIIAPPIAFEGGLTNKDKEVTTSYAFVMALADQKGNIYVLDFMKNKFWLIARTGVAGSAIQFNSIRRRELLVALADHSIHCYNIDTCQLIAKLPIVHQSIPTMISVHSTRHLAISTSSTEAVLWDTDTWVRKRVLEGFGIASSSGGGVQQTMFSPDGLMICAAFEDGSIFFWSIDTFSLVWKITLSSLAASSASSRATIPAGVTAAQLETEFGASMARSLRIPRQSYFALSASGELFAYGGLSSTLYLWNLYEKRLLHEILIPSFEGHVISHLAFLGTTDVLALLSSGGEIIFINAAHATFVSQLKGRHKFQGFSLSPDGMCMSTSSVDSRFLVSLLRLDQVIDPNLVDDTPSLPLVLDEAGETLGNAAIPGKQRAKEGEQEDYASKVASATVPKTFFELVESKQESTMFNRSKLRGFLNHYGSYPEQYRPLIWRYLLKLPENRAGYESLLDQGTHASFKDFRKKFPLKSDKAAKSMERILSCLAFWSPIFEDLDYLPSLVFPFVKLFWNDLFSGLEVVMTILINWCQKWWEYYPNPPIETLDLITQLLEKHDPQLLDHFTRCKVTSQIYGWTLMQSLFSELFSKRDWFIVCDHLISNPPSFFYHFITAYIIHFRNALLGTSDLKDFYYFFQRRNPTSVTSLILLAYKLKQKTPTSIDPSSFLKPFTPCVPGEYPIFNQYPQFIVNYQSRMKNKIRQEEHDYLKKRQLATELGRLTEELKKEKEGWEQSDWKMNEMVEKWWGQMMENEEKRSQIQSRINSVEKDKRMDVLTQIAHTRKSFASTQANSTQEHIQKIARSVGQVARGAAKATKSGQTPPPPVLKMRDNISLEDVENEWALRREEMIQSRKELAKSQASKAEKLVVDSFTERGLEEGRAADPTPIPTAAAANITPSKPSEQVRSVAPVPPSSHFNSTADAFNVSSTQLEALKIGTDLSAIASSSHAQEIDVDVSPTKSVTFAF